jgi:rhodanese-related sulfurtransferase
MGILSLLFGKKETINFKEIIQEGGVVIDVRTGNEFKSGHIKNAKNISVQQLSSQLNKLDPKSPIITCCASGMRSASAVSILKKAGFRAYNGGSWQSLQNKLS